MSFQFQFHEIDSPASLSRLAKVFGSELSHDTITVNKIFGAGKIHHAQLEEGLHLRVWDLKLNGTLQLKKIQVISEKMFHIAWLLNPATLQYVLPGNIILARNDKEMEMEMTHGLQALEISFTASWLEKTFKQEAVDPKMFIHYLLHNEEPILFFESTTTLEYRLLSKVHHSLAPGIINLLRLKAGIFPLLSGFFSRVKETHVQNAAIIKPHHYDKMIAVEQLLCSHLQKKLPSIDSIAKQNALSESSLKRYFKEAFGKGIYEYYLGLKMDAAKKILLNENSSVNEVALQFNYETVSSFIDMFKRHHGVSPGALRKKMGN